MSVAAIRTTLCRSRRLYDMGERETIKKKIRWNLHHSQWRETAPMYEICLIDCATPQTLKYENTMERPP